MHLFTRDARIVRAKTADESATTADGYVVELAMASEEPVERWFGTEVLRIEEGTVRLDRLNDGASLLFNHNWSDLRGVHVKGGTRIDSDKVVRGPVRIEIATEKGRETAALVQADVLTKSSVGYSIYRVIEKVKGKDGRELTREISGDVYMRAVARCEAAGLQTRSALCAEFGRLDPALKLKAQRSDDDYPTYEVIDWEPFENSLVTVPADRHVGVGRSASVTTVVTTVVNNSAIPAAIEVREMEQKEEGAEKVSAVQAEKQRRGAIISLCKALNIDSRVEAAFITDGTPLDDTLNADGTIRVKGVSSQLLDVVEERGKAKPATAAAIGLTRSETQNYSLFRVIRHLRDRGDPSAREAAAFELDCSRAVAKKMGRDGSSNILIPAEILTRSMSQEVMERALATTPGSKGGYMVDVVNMGFIDILRNRSVARAMGARVLAGLEGNVTFGRQTGKPTVSWQGGENTNTNAADQTLGQLSMTPKTAIVITDVSEQMLRQSHPSAEQFVMADLAADIAVDGVDYSSINGVGGAQPLGIKNTTGITTGQDAATLTYGKALAFPTVAGGLNAIRGNPGWVTNIAGAAIGMQRQRFSNTDTPLWEGNLMDGTLVGFRAMSSEQVPSGNLIFGSWDELVIGEWGVLELSTDAGGSRFNNAQVGIRAMWMVDVMIRYPQAFVVGVNLS